MAFVINLFVVCVFAEGFYGVLTEDDVSVGYPKGASGRQAGKGAGEVLACAPVTAWLRLRKTGGCLAGLRMVAG